MIIQKNISLDQHHTFRCPIKTQFFTTLSRAADIQTIQQQPEFDANQTVILGGGSNILFRQHFPGLIIQNKIKGIEQIQKNKHHVWLQIGAGENWHEFVRYCVQQQYYGVENLSLIPGTVGAAPIQNIGAYGVQLEDVFDHLNAIDLHTGQSQRFSAEQCEFGYRNSVFKSRFKNRFCITNVTLKLSLTPTFQCQYPALKSHISEHKMELTLNNLHQAIIQIRSSKLPCPKQLPNAGSFFKNPFIQHAQLQSLKKQFPNMPYFPEHQNQVKVPAAWLIEQCQFKGKRFGPVGIHEQHALVLINYDNGSGDQLHDLAQHITATVKEKFDILLEKEVNII